MAGDDNPMKGVSSSSSNLSLTFGDPLCLHPNDTSGSPIVTIKLTSTENYKILNSLSSDLYASAIYAKSTFELWNDLKDTYYKVDGSAIFNLHKSINSLNQNGASLADYYNNLNSSWKQFDAMVSLPACTCEATEHFEKHNQLIKLMQFLMGLDDNYLTIRSNILTREPLPLVKADFAIVSGEESHRNITSSGATKPTATTFAAKTFDKKMFNSNNYNKGSSSNSNTNNMGPNPNLKCTNCNKIGHTLDRCFEIVGYSAGYVKWNFNPNSKPVTSNNTVVDPHSNNASSNSASNSPVSLFNEKLTRLMNLLNDNGVFTANANMSVNVVDISNLGLTVGHPNGTQALVTEIGDLKISNNITLYDVLVVPEYTISLLSVHKLSRDNKLFVGFNESNCYIQDLKANKTVGIGRQFNGLYMFDVDNACKIVSNNCISTCFVSQTLWHQRLGHPANQVLDALKTSLNLDSHSTSDHLCDTCNKAKQTRESFPLSDHKSNKIELSPDNQGDDNSEATSMDETNNTHHEGTVLNETYFINDFYENSEFNSDVEELPANTLRRSCRQTKLPFSLNDFIVEEKIDAMNAEIEALNENHIWVITDLPANRKAIRNKWIYKIKYKASGDIDRYKARLVVKGFNKKEGIDFDETFSHVVKMFTVRCVIALSITNNWPLFQLDVNNVFLYGDLDEDIYMTIPKWFASKDNKNKVCKLVKSLYGLKQAPRKWNEKLFTILKENDFVQSANDHSLFTKSKDNKFIALLVYVDDIVVTGNFIKTDKVLCLFQRKYCQELLKEYGLLGCKPVSTPMEPNSVLPFIPTKDDPLLDNITGYQKLLGKLIYLTQNTISKSSTETEYRSLSSAACEITWIQKLLLDLKTKVTLPVNLFCDNKSALQLAINPVFHERSKHFEIDVHFIKEEIAKALLSTKKICSLN
ncbi:ribonuclease H-like domain-containing protein [Tanacetum coccineum]